MNKSSRSKNIDNKDETEKKGTKTKLFGMGLIFLGGLDSMLSWRGGLTVNDFYLWLFVIGISLYLIGAIRTNRFESINRQANNRHINSSQINNTQTRLQQ